MENTDSDVLHNVYLKLGREHDCFETERGFCCRGDARVLIKYLPDESVDAVITDPPWGLTEDDDDDPNVFFDLEEDMYRVLKRDAWLIFYYSPRNIPLINRFKLFEYVWIMPYIFHGEPTARNPFGTKMSYSIVVVMRKGRPKVKRRRRDVLEADELPFLSDIPKDPLFKPTLVSSQLLFMFTEVNDVVLDPFSGLGSIPFVCEIFRRRWVSFEIDVARYEFSKRFIIDNML